MYIKTYKRREATNEKYKTKQKIDSSLIGDVGIAMKIASVFLFCSICIYLYATTTKTTDDKGTSFFFILFYSVVLLLQMILCYNEHYNLRLLTCFAVAFCCCCCYCCLSLYKYILYTYTLYILFLLYYELHTNIILYAVWTFQ